MGSTGALAALLGLRKEECGLDLCGDLAVCGKDLEDALSHVMTLEPACRDTCARLGEGLVRHVIDGTWLDEFQSAKVPVTQWPKQTLEELYSVTYEFGQPPEDVGEYKGEYRIEAAHASFSTGLFGFEPLLVRPKHAHARTGKT
ncbi:hypothetical protein AC579_623 [Pseudocercospora musae]|uniref:Uncharacterized protein n=1 Tax=Pseudocercospora musae TaxID=113226 RepID=A0A139HQH5_9PEZI|nr:hypothetical protein AC579_623 [Pseudocercospora musae]